MGAFVIMALAAALTLNQVEVPTKFEHKPCDAKTGCLHPAFK